jgi:hypothetical protein
LIYRIRNSSVLFFDFSGEKIVIIDPCLVVEKLRKRLTVSKQITHRVHMERFNLKKLKELEDKEHYRVKILNEFEALKT